MTKMRRIGVVEVGSRAVRLLVADVSADSGIQAVASDWRETQLASALVSDQATIRAKIDSVAAVTDGFLERCASLGAEDTCVVGTEAVRRLRAEDLAYATRRVSGLAVMGKKAEASCSLIAGMKGFEESRDGGLTMVMDQGAGSMEVAVGEVRDASFRLDYAASFPLGSQVLVDARRRQADLPSYSVRLSEEIRSFVWPEPQVISSCGVPIVLGSAATKIAWMKVRTAADRRYDSRKVHGEVVDVKTIEWLVNAASASPQTVMSLIEPEPDPERILVALAGLGIVMRVLGKESFRVSGLGMRYGVAWIVGVLGKRVIEEGA